MAVWIDLRGTTRNSLRIGKNKFNIDANNATSLRQLNLGNADISFNSPTTGQVLQYNGTSWVPATLSSGPSNVQLIQSTTISFNSSSPVTMFTLPANHIILECRVIIDTQFNGTPTLEVGISGNTDKYLEQVDVNLTDVAGSVYSAIKGNAPPVSNESIIATYSAGGATIGSARIIVLHGLPS
jgi:hypothetical protein